MEWGMPMGRRLRMERMTTRSLKAALFWMSILPTLTLGPSFTLKAMDSEEGGKLAHLGRDLGELPPALGQILLEHDSGPLNLAGVVHRFDAETDAPLLEAIQDLGDGDRLDSRVGDGADDLALGQHEAQDLSGLARLDLHADVVEPSGVPEGHEVAPQGVVVDLVAPLGENHRSQGVLRNPPGAAKLDGLDHVRCELRAAAPLAGTGGLERGGLLLGCVRFGWLHFGLRGLGGGPDGFKRVLPLRGRRLLRAGYAQAGCRGKPRQSSGRAACCTSSRPSSFPLCALMETHKTRFPFQK